MERLQSIMVWCLQQIKKLLQGAIDMFWSTVQNIQDSSQEALNDMWVFFDPVRSELLEILPLLMVIGQGILTLKILIMGIILMYPGSWPFQGGSAGLRRYWWPILTDIRWTAAFFLILYLSSIF